MTSLELALKSIVSLCLGILGGLAAASLVRYLFGV